MHTTLIVTGIVIVVALLLGWMIGRFHSRAGTIIGLVGQLLARFVIVCAMGYSATRAAEHGDWFIALAVLLALIGVAALGMAGVMAAALWMSLSDRATD